MLAAANVVIASAESSADTDPLAGGDHRDRRERRQQPDKLPPAESFFQEKTRQQDRHRRIKRSDHHSFIEPASLARIDEQCAGRDVEEPRDHAQANGGTIQIEWCARGDHRNRGCRERPDP